MVVQPNKEADMRNIDDIIVAAHKAMAASLHEAFEAGRAHTAHELKSRMAAFFEGLAAEAETNAAAAETHAAAPDAPQPDAPQPDAPPSEEQRHE
jgi:hypothetical protein